MTKHRPFKFKVPKNKLEGPVTLSGCELPGGLYGSCPLCKKMVLCEDLINNYYICPSCKKSLKLGARKRIELFCDDGSFFELNGGITSQNFLDFPGYDEKLRASSEQSGESEAVITGTCAIEGRRCCVFVMEPYFMMGSMGSVVGDKIAALFEYAAQNSLPVIGWTVSGGARMQEGMLSLMQMAKVSAALKRHSRKGLLYIAVLCDPTAGGVTASFAMSADIIAAEPGALICFAGPRVIEQTMRQKLPPGFQTAEFLSEKGFIDIIVERKDQRKFLADMLYYHSAKEVV